MSAPTQKNQVIDTAATRAQKLGLSKEIAAAVAQSVIALWTAQNQNNTNQTHNTQGANTTAKTSSGNQGNSATANFSNTTTKSTARNATTNAKSASANKTASATTADRTGIQGPVGLDSNWNNNIAEIVTNTVSAAYKVDPTLSNKADALAELIAATITAVAGNNTNITVDGIKQQVVTAAKNKSSAA